MFYKHFYIKLAKGGKCNKSISEVTLEKIHKKRGSKMIILEEKAQIISAEGLRKKVKEAEKILGRKITVIVGTNESVDDKTLHKYLADAERIVREHNMKFAALSMGDLEKGLFTLNILFAEYLDDNNACANFLIKQVKYNLTKVNLVD